MEIIFLAFLTTVGIFVTGAVLGNVVVELTKRLAKWISMKY